MGFFGELLGEILDDDEVKDSLKKGAKDFFGTLMDQDGDGDVDGDDAAVLMDQSKYLVSVWGHAALADGSLEDEEMEAVSNLMDNVIFEDFLTTEALELLEISKKKAKKILFEQFENPMSIKKLSRYADEAECEEIFYDHACAIIASDDKIGPDEREFLDMFAEALDLNKFDRKKIERINFESK